MREIYQISILLFEFDKEEHDGLLRVSKKFIIAIVLKFQLSENERIFHRFFYENRLINLAIGNT